MTDDEARPAGGQALKTAIHIARERVEIPSDRQLAFRAGVSYDTLMNWFAERTIPRPAELGKVAKVLDVRLVELMDVYEGRDPQPPGLEQRLGELIDELRIAVMEMRMGRVQQEEQTAALLRALGLSVRSVPGPRETPSGNEPGARAGNRRP
ncbi:MAG TPA: helix-turn-helix transcriptional regulator [Candidatus Limnocylindrales bacterium]|nr:helix-turn-helix transcriptional regulator [Candidatus Limnocylindrales bacterium]